MSVGRDHQTFDVLIAGAGVAGLAMALAIIQRLGPDLKLAVIGEKPTKFDTLRAYAIAPDVRRNLESLKVWQEVADRAEPVMEMAITDSRSADPVRPVLLSLRDGENPREPLAHVIDEGRLQTALWRRFTESRRALVHSAVECLEQERASGRARISVRLSSGDVLNGRLLIAADGASSTCRESAGIGIVAAGYGQSAIVATVGHEREHKGRAVQHFLPGGPLARLPLPGRQCSIVWTMPSAAAARLVALPSVDFVAELEETFGFDLGETELAAGPASFPLRVQMARTFISHRLALIGDAAHVVHPLAGQGLNLGLRDAEALAGVIADAAKLGLDFGSVISLADYERNRRYAAFAMAATTDALNRLFSNDVAPIRLLRDLGLGLVDRLPTLKNQIIAGAAR